MAAGCCSGAGQDPCSAPEPLAAVNQQHEDCGSEGCHSDSNVNEGYDCCEDDACGNFPDESRSFDSAGRSASLTCCDSNEEHCNGT